jgi:hypothetical protein
MRGNAGKGKTIALNDGRNEVGRALTCQVSLDGDGISKVHAVISVEAAGVFVEDMGSTNKSMLGSLEEPVELVPGQKYPMEHGDVVVFGDVACVFLWRAMQSFAASRSVRTAPPNHSSLDESGMHLTGRPQTTALHNLSQEEVLGQLDILMHGMSQLYSIVQGTPAGTRLGTHASGHASSFGGTRAHTAADSIASHNESSVSFALDRSDLPHFSPYRQSQASLSVTAGAAVGFFGNDRAGTNLQGAGRTTTDQPPAPTDNPLPGLHRSAPLAPRGPDLAPADYMHLYAGVSRGGTTGSQRRPGTHARPSTTRSRMSTAGAPAVSQEMVAFGRFKVPQNVLMNILVLTPRIPYLLRLSCVSAALRRMCTHEMLWDELDVAWDTFTPDPICNSMTDTLLARILATTYRALLRKVNLSGCTFVNDWTLHALSRHAFNVEHLSLACYADIGPKITDAGLVVLLRCVPKLRSLSVAWCTKIGSSSCATLADYCPELTSLDLSGCCALYDLSVMRVAAAQCGPKLEHLSLRSCELITSDAVNSIAHNCSSLTKLDLGGCERVRGQAIVSILDACTNLTDLDVTQCHQVGASAPVFLRVY